MARNVKISTIGSSYAQVDGSLSNQEMWEKVKEHVAKQVDQVLPDKPDLIVLTEMCDFPFPKSYSMDFAGPFSDSRGTDNVRFFSRIAKENGCNLSFSTIARGVGGYYTNTTFLLDRGGKIAGRYDKYYVTGGENRCNIKYGDKTPIFKMDFGTVACAICFDLNFDDLRERYKALKPELIIFASQFHGGLLQQIWANECRSYFVGSIAHQRPSAVLSPLGEMVAYSTDYLNFATATVNFDYALAHLKEKKKLLDLKDKYGAGATLYDPCYLGYFMLTCESPDMSIDEMLKEFDILTYDEYIIESREQRNWPDNQGENAVEY